MSIRKFLISTVAFAILPTTAILRAADTAEYTGGSVKSIPMNSIGFLSADDEKALQFSYGKVIYKLPYEQITGTEITKGDKHHVMKKIPVPSLFGKNKETLTISYKDGAGASGTLSFELTARLATATQAGISDQRAAIQAAAANPSNEWWGDKYWKTLSNKPTWDAAQAAAASKQAQAAVPASAPAPAPATKN
jgi:hypothetical protein